ncbi:MAG TPA: M28 family peptidase, partial [Longimicrobiales bacterium]|nr:M28 family peptidase [Longimicrobiales bacterium]
RGLLGSSYFAAHPTLPLEDMVAAINLDAGAPPAPPLTWRIAGGSVSTLGETARTVAARRGWTAEPGDPAPNSDYWGLLTRGVPAIFIIPGGEWEGIEGEARERLRTRWEHYHQPSDEWHPDFPFAGLERYARFALEVGLAVADGPRRPRMLFSGDEGR